MTDENERLKRIIELGAKLTRFPERRAELDAREAEIQEERASIDRQERECHEELVRLVSAPVAPTPARASPGRPASHARRVFDDLLANGESEVHEIAKRVFPEHTEEMAIERTRWGIGRLQQRKVVTSPTRGRYAIVPGATFHDQRGEE